MLKILIKIFLLLMMIPLSACSLQSDKTEGRYLVNYINSDENRCKNDEKYFYVVSDTLFCYWFNTGKLEEVVELDYEKEGKIIGFAISDNLIFYVKKKGQECELRKLNRTTGKESCVLTNADIIQLNDGELLENRENPFPIRTYNGHLLFATSDRCVYIVSAGGDIKTESVNVNALFPTEDKSGEKQSITFSEMIIKRYYCAELEAYRISEIRTKEGNRILYADNPSVVVNGEQIVFHKEDDDYNYQYQIEDDNHVYDIRVLQKEMYIPSKIVEEHLTTEGGKIIGWISISSHPLYRDILYQEDIKKEVLFELDIQTGESHKLYDTRNNLTKIIGYQNGIVYLVKNEKVYAHTLETEIETELFELPKGLNYIIDWQSDYLIIREEFCYGQNGDIIMIYQL